MNDRKMCVQRWLDMAEDDITTAETMMSTPPPRTRVVCFHAQQCAEKCLKAYLVLKDHHFEKKHDLPYLISLCEKYDPEFSKLETVTAGMTIYAVTSRYPDDWREIPVDEAREALNNARTVMSFVKAKL